MRATLGRLSFLSFAAATAVLLFLPLHSGAKEEEEGEETLGAPLSVDVAGTVSEAAPIQAAATAVISIQDLARAQGQAPTQPGPYRTWMPVEREHPAEPYFPPAPSEKVLQSPLPPLGPSPSPTWSFMGLNDIPMVDSMYIVIPPDVDGAVGPTKIMEALNNNYRIRGKATGTTISTVGTATFWAPVVAANERLSLTDPRTLFDPYNHCWISVMQTTTSGAGKILVGVSQTDDPSGSWYLYSFNTSATVDFPIVGFNKNWISVSINRYGVLGNFQRGINLVVNYPLARAGTGTGTLITQSANTHFSSAPSATYSATAETLYVVTHLNSSGATYEVDTITGTAGSPVYTSGGSLTRTGGGWGTMSGNSLPQAPPLAGTSACGAPPSGPCKMEIQDSNVRSAPVFRGGFLYYTQTVPLPSSGPSHSAVQWTKISAPGGAYADGGRIDDPTATATNGGKWYAYPHIAVNAVGDFLVGYSQFSSAQYPSAGYSVHRSGDALGTLRDPVIYHAGEDYYHKTFSTTTGRNRWGDFSVAQVDPSDDTTLWTLQEYAKARTGIDDGNTGSNSSRWSTWWAGVNPVITYTITATAGPGGSIDPSGAVLVPEGSDTTFTVTPNGGFAIQDVMVDGISVGAPLTVPFANIQANHTIHAAFMDPAAPTCQVDFPNGGDTLTVTHSTLLAWTTSDNDTVACVDILLSRAGAGGPYDTLAACIPDTAHYAWTVTGPATDHGVFRIVAHDASGNTCSDDSNAEFTIRSSQTGVFELPGHLEFSLAAISSNPAPGSSRMMLTVPDTRHVRVAVYDVSGREVEVLADRDCAPGQYEIPWAAGEGSHPVPAGIYFVRATGLGKSVVLRVTVTH